MNEQILQKYINLLSQKIYDCFVLETQLENLDVVLQDRDKEIERLKKLLDDNNINYETDEEKGHEVALSPVEDVKEENTKEN